MANNELKDRGSRKHLLDLVESPEFVSSLDRLLQRTGFRLAEEAHPQPSGRSHPGDWAEYEVEEYFNEPARRILGQPAIKEHWWIESKSKRNRRPCFDLIARLRSEDNRDGLLLVEAKAHESEAKIKDSKKPPTDSPKSRANDARIKRRVRESRAALNRLRIGTARLSTDDHYQLANRLAYSVCLANLGYHVVLLYLGFEGDTYFKDFLRDGDHWQRVVGGYFQAVLPQVFVERWLPLAPGALFVAVDSLGVKEKSKRPGGGP